jgi:predicted porin
MQKKVIALAVAALASGAAMAQSNVTLYGIADAVGTVFNTSNNTAGLMKTQKGFDDGAVGSRIGFKGTEDLGSGLKAEFLFELGVQPTNNINQVNSTSTNSATGINQNSFALNALNTRQSYVAITSDSVGQFAVGRFQTPGWDYQAIARPWGGVDPVRTMSNIFGMNLNSSDRISNAFQYTSPVFSGFKAKYLFSADGSKNADLRTNDQSYVSPTATQTGAQRVNYLAGYYDQGPISSQLVYRKANKTADNATDDGKYEWALRGAYDFGVVKPGLFYQRQHLNTASVTAYGNYQVGYTYGGFVTAPIGSSFLLTLEATKAKGDLSTGGYGYMVNGQYLFSKRTSIYAQAGYMKLNNENGLTGVAATTNLGSYGSTPIQAGQHLTGFMAGILHSF